MRGERKARELLQRWLGASGAGTRRNAGGRRAVPAAAPLPHRPLGQQAAALPDRGQRHHCIISGTGRAGTSFLVQLLTRLGLDTGVSAGKLALHADARAGLEADIRKDDAPYIVKSPWLCDYIEEVLARPDIVIDHAFIPMRSISAAAQSRIEVERAAGTEQAGRVVPGGLWGTGRDEDQEPVLLAKFYALLWPLVRHGVPVTFLAYPRLVRDPAYLHESLAPLVAAIPFDEFERAWREVVRPEWVHQFAEDDTPAEATPFAFSG